MLILLGLSFFAAVALAANAVAHGSGGNLASANGLFRSIPLTYTSNSTEISSAGDGFCFTLAHAGSVQFDFSGTWTVLDCGTVGYKALFAISPPVGSIFPYLVQLPNLSGNFASNPTSAVVSLSAATYCFKFSASCATKASTVSNFAVTITKTI